MSKEKDFEIGWAEKDDMEDVERTISKDGKIWCEHCGNMEAKVSYFDGTNWCSWCAYANGYISDKQLEIDKEKK